MSDWCTAQDIEDAHMNVPEAVRTLAARCDKLERDLAQLKAIINIGFPAAGVRVSVHDVV